MQANLPQVGFGILSRLVVVFIALGVSFEPGSACVEARQEQIADYPIAFASLAPWDLDVFIANADGSNPHPLASHPDLDYNAAFSPDGQWIVFTSHRNGSADLYRVHPDGSGLRSISCASARRTRPIVRCLSWSARLRVW